MPDGRLLARLLSCIEQFLGNRFPWILTAVMASSLQAQGAVREQLAYWEFGPNAAGFTAAPTYSSPALLTVPPAIIFGGSQFDSNGKDGEPYGPDARGLSHSPGQAAAWDEVDSAVDAGWIVELDTRTWKSLEVRFDYKCDSAPTPITQMDILYRTSSSAGWSSLLNTAGAEFTADGNFHSFSYTVTSTALDNKPFVQMLFTNLTEVGGDNVFVFDNFEITALSAAPATPTGLTANADSTPQVVLAWTAPTIPVDGYYIRRQDAGSGAYNLIATITNSGAVAFVDTSGLLDYTSYAYRVSAFNVDAEGSYASATDRTPPAPPVIVSCIRNANQTVTVDWNASTGTSNYRVRRSNTPNGPYVQIAQVTSSTTVYTDTPGAGTFYYVVVSTNTTYGVSRNSTTSLCGLPAPTSLVATALATPQVVLSWNTVVGATTYSVWRSTTPGSLSGGNYTLVASQLATAAYVDAVPSIADGTSYYYVVSATDGSCTGAISAEARAVTPLAPPAGLTATPGAGAISLSWPAVPGAAGYNLKRSPTSGGPYIKVQTTSGLTAKDYVVGGTFYYVVTAVNSLNAEGRNSPQASTSIPFLVINEVKANPPGSASDTPPRPDSLWEYIELKGTPNYNLANHRVVVLNGRQQGLIGRGVATLVVPLSGTLPASGIVLIKQAGHGAPQPNVLEITVQQSHRIVAGPTTNPDDELIVNDASTVLLATGGTAPTPGTDYDSGDNGQLDGSWSSTLGQTILDAVAWKTTDNDDYVYDGAARLRQTDGVPSAATRIRESVTPNSPMAWWFGDLIGSPSSLAYDTSDPDNLSGSSVGNGAPFNAGCFLTPGAPNEPNTQAFLAASFPPIAPQGLYVLPNELNSYISWPNVLLSDFNNPIPAPASVAVSFNNSPTLIDTPSHLAAFLANGYWWLKIQADHVGANRLVTVIPDNDWSRARSIAFSTLEAHPDSIRTTGFSPYGISSTTLFHEGISGASTALKFYTPYEGARFPVIADDDQNSISQFFYFAVSGGGNYLPNLTQSLGVVSEVDIEASAFKPEPDDFNGQIGIGGFGYWTGSMANGPAPTSAIRPDTDRLFSTTISYTGLGNYSMALRGYSKKVRTALSNSTQYATYRLAESMRAGEDSKAPWGFDIEGMELSPDGSTMYLGLRAPLVPAPAANLTIRDSSRGQLALIVPVNNYHTITDAMDDTTAPVFGAPITLNLGGRGIRSIHRKGSTYYIIAGSPTNSTYRPGDFAIYSWTGNPAHIPVELAADLAGRNPEGIADDQDPFGISSVPILRLVEDNGTFDWYGEGAENKDFPLPLWSRLKKSRQFEVRLGIMPWPEYFLDAPGQAYFTGANAGYGIHKYQDPSYDYWIVGTGGNIGNNIRAVGFPWDNGPTDPSLVLATLATSSMNTNDIATGVAGGTAIGTSQNGGQNYPVVWGLASGAITKMLVGGIAGEARGISPVKDPTLNAHIAVGMYLSAGTHAFYNTASGPQTATELPGVVGATYTVANAINENFTIVGASGTPTLRTACAWVSINDVYQLVSLPKLSGVLSTDSSEALGINANGTIVGYCQSNNVKWPCLWAFVDSRWNVYALPSLDPTRNTEVRDINTRGEMVGTAFTATGPHGCIWINGKVEDLNNLIGIYGPTLPPGQQNVTIMSANAINEVGWITGGLSCQESLCWASRSYLLRP